MKVLKKCENPITGHAVRVQVLAKVVVLYSEHPLMIILSRDKQTKQLHPSCKDNLNAWGRRGCKLVQTI